MVATHVLCTDHATPHVPFGGSAAVGNFTRTQHHFLLRMDYCHIFDGTIKGELFSTEQGKKVFTGTE